MKKNVDFIEIFEGLDTEEKNNISSNWETDAMRELIQDNEPSEDKLRSSWDKYNSMPLKHRRESDLKSLELYGKTNKERYEDQLSFFLKTNDVEIELDEDGKLITDVKVNIVVSYEAEESAKKWAVIAMRYIITPTSNLNELETIWLGFNSMPLKHRRESDWKSLELFGVANQVHYEFLKSKFLKKDNSEDIEMKRGLDLSVIESMCYDIKQSENMYDKIQKCMMISNASYKSLSENLLIKDTINESINIIEDKLNIPLKVDATSVPFFSTEEMDNFGVFSGEINKFSPVSDNQFLDDGTTPVKKWYEHYKLFCNGIKTDRFEKYTSLWIKKLNELYLTFDELKKSGDLKKINSRKQSILELGWNPYIDFSVENRIKATCRLEKILENVYSDKFIDVTDMVDRFEINEEFSLDTTDRSRQYQPVFVIFAISNSPLNNVIKKLDSSGSVPYGHTAIGFDPTLAELYSYNIKQNGFARESLYEYKDIIRFTVFMTMIKTEKVLKMKNYIRNHDRHDTSYSNLNLVTMKLGINYSMNYRMVCSQFVDSVLKIGDIDITKKVSGLVTPSSLADKMKMKNKLFYKVYDGSIRGYDNKKVKAFIDSKYQPTISIHDKFDHIENIHEYVASISENIHDANSISYLEKEKEKLNTTSRLVFDKMIKPFVLAESNNEFPIQFDNDGDLVIRKYTKRNLNQDFANTHKLLVQYDQTKNYNGMKQELCKLWYMNISIENLIYNEKLKDDEKADLYKVRALVLNDFNKYLKIILDSENNFNFAKYYDNSQYNHNKVRIKSSTLKYTTKYIKSILNNI